MNKINKVEKLINRKKMIEEKIADLGRSRKEFNSLARHTGPYAPYWTIFGTPPCTVSGEPTFTLHIGSNHQDSIIRFTNRMLQEEMKSLKELLEEVTFELAGLLRLKELPGRDDDE